jgi:hypothetical protein
MTSTIAYDKPVRNLISQLNETGHVTHTKYKKTSVTIHHNGGRLSHEGVLNVWKTRPASAHFDVDSTGAVAQYVDVHEYAWAVGSTAGNRTTISIEQCNKTLSPGWEVADVTWQNAARLAGWLFAHVVDGTPRPTKDNLFYHKHWSATDCAGPYMDKIYGKVLKAAQDAYDSFKGSKTPPKTSKPSGSDVVADVIAGKYGNGADRVKALKAAGYDPEEVQDAVNETLKGNSPASPRPSTPDKKSINAVAKDVIAGKYGNGLDRRHALLHAGYNPAAVQDEVNRILDAPKGRESIKTIAHQVMVGKWGNGAERVKRLTKAGYNAKNVQKEVNALIKRRR